MVNTYLQRVSLKRKKKCDPLPLSSNNLGEIFHRSLVVIFSDLTKIDDSSFWSSSQTTTECEDDVWTSWPREVRGDGTDYCVSQRSDLLGLLGDFMFTGRRTFVFFKFVKLEVNINAS